MKLTSYYQIIQSSGICFLLESNSMKFWVRSPKSAVAESSLPLIWFIIVHDFLELHAIFYVVRLQIIHDSLVNLLKQSTSICKHVTETAKF